MTQRSQRHRAEVHGPYLPPITSILPDTATIAAVGAVGRTVATMSVVGGTPPIAYMIANAAGLSLVISGNLLNTSVDPVGTVGVKSVSITVTDSVGKTLTETIAVTVT